MKLYVWENVFCDYTCGLAFAVANSLEEAISVAVEDEMFENELRNTKPVIYDIDKPVGNMVTGGQ